MKTDDLIEALSRQAEPAPAGQPRRRLLLASLLGVAAAVPLMLALLGLNPQLGADAQTPMFLVKALFVVATGTLAWLVVRRLGRPGVDARPVVRGLALPFVLMVALAAVQLASAPAGERMPLVLGTSWATCPFSIALLSLPALALLLATMRSLAPTQLRAAGAAAGLLAGALGALAYLLHCPELAAPFLAIWYVLGMLIPAVVGALLAPRVLAW